MDALFEIEGVRARELHEADLGALQAFFEANPAYFIATNGYAPRPDEARDEFFDRPPPPMSHGSVQVIGFEDATGRPLAMASVLAHLMARDVWHVGLFIVDQSLHGRGAAASFYRALERWIVSQGAVWLRLGVIAGNARAESFWARMGYVELRRRSGLTYGQLTHTVRVMAKPLAERSLDDYLAQVPRDRPET